MLQTLKRLRKLLSVPLQWLVILAMAVMTLDILWGVLARYVLPSGIEAEIGACLWLRDTIGYAWTDELATSLLVWVGLLGSCVAYERKAHLGVDVLTSKLAPEARKLSELFVHFLVGSFAAIALIYGGWEVFCESYNNGNGEVMTALRYPSGEGIPKAFAIYLAVPVAGVVFTLLALENFIETLLTPPTELIDPSETTEVSHG